MVDRPVVTLDWLELQFSPPLVLWLLACLIFWLLWIVPTELSRRFGRVAGIETLPAESGGQRHGSSGGNLPRLAFVDSLAFLPFLVFLPFFFLGDRLGRDPLEPLLAWSIVTHLLLRVVILARHDCGRALRDHVSQAIDSLGTFKTWLILVVLFFGLYLLVAARFLTAGMGLEGDEPEYVIVAQSLIHDGDIMIRDNYQRLEYRLFLRHPLDFGRTTWEGYPVEGMLLSMLILPSYALARVTQVDPVTALRLTMPLFAALFVGELFLLLAWISRSRQTALVTAIAAGLTSPVVFYAPLVFSEIPGALFFALSIRSLGNFRRFRSAKFLAVGAIAALLWTGAKYLALAAGLLAWLAVAIFIDLRHGPPRERKGAMAALGILVLLMAGYLGFLWHYYHSFSPLATRGGELLEFTRSKGTSLFDSLAWVFGDRLSRMPYSFRVGVGYFLDQKIGLLVYSPVYLLFFAGVVIALRKKLWKTAPAFIIFFLYWFMLFWLSYWEGYGPPTRYLLPAIPVLAIGLAVAMEHSRTARRFMVGLAGISLGWTVLGLKNPWLLYHHTLWRLPDSVNNALAEMSGFRFRLHRLVPSFTKVDFDWVVFLAWFLGSALVVTIVVLESPPWAPRIVKKLFTIAWAAAPLVCWSLVLADPKPLVQRANPIWAASDLASITSSGPGAYDWEHDGFWAQPGRWSRIMFDSSGDLATTLTIKVHSLVKNTLVCRAGWRDVRIELPAVEARIVAFRNLTQVETGTGHFGRINMLPQKGRNLFYQGEADDGRELGVYIEPTAPAASGGVPKPTPTD